MDFSRTDLNYQAIYIAIFKRNFRQESGPRTFGRIGKSVELWAEVCWIEKLWFYV